MQRARALGDMLVAKGLIDIDTCESALRQQQLTGVRIGDILIARGMVSYFTLYQALAEHTGAPFADLQADPPDGTLLHASDVDDYIRYRAVPWRRERKTFTIATSEPCPSLSAWAERRFGEKVMFAIASPRDIREVIEREFSEQLSEESRHALYRIAPEQSARITFMRDQKFFFLTLFAVVMAGLLMQPIITAAVLIVMFHILYAITMVFKWTVFSLGNAAASRAQTVSYVPEAELPIYTILLPMYREGEGVKHILAALKKLDYPQEKLDIKLVLEADDHETIQAAIALKPAENVEIIRVPYSLPRTKPKACNYALRFARGEFVTIYDAEDKPEPMQLKKAVAAFRNAPPNVVCFQAHLRYYNADENLLTRWFDMEYGVLFGSVLSGLQALSIPLPLGGTSNHFVLEKLREVGEWDPYNVTEDADLGVRLSAAGLYTRVLDSVTYEEAVIHVPSWLKQRSRWIKGYMQTWLVHMRNPMQLYRRIGGVSFFGLQFFIGIPCLTFLTAPLIWLLSLIFLFGVPLIGENPLPDWFVPLAWLNLVMYFGLHWHQAFTMVPKMEGVKRHLTNAALTFPVYWVLHSVASYKALWQLIVKPHFWEKTTHGISARLQLAPA